MNSELPVQIPNGPTRHFCSPLL